MTTTCEQYVPPAPLDKIQAELLDGLDAAAVRWFGRGGTALYWAYRLAAEGPVGPAGADDAAGKPEVIVPAMMCATPVNAACLAGCEPRFADVDRHTGMTTLEHVQTRWTPRTRAVLFVHLFGQTAALGPMARWCAERDVLLIEDAAQAQGAVLPNGSAAGGVGDLGVFSFNPTKILETGGGALVLRRPDLEDRLTAVQNAGRPLPAINPGRAATLAASYRNLHHSLATLLRLGVSPQRVSDAFMRLRSDYDGLYLDDRLDAVALANAWATLPSKITRRKQKADIYAELLADGPWELLTGYRQSEVCWRFSLLADFPAGVVELSEAIRRDGFHVSNLYWPVNQFFRPEDKCPNADDFARRVVNLWVDDSTDEAWVRRCAASLREHSRRLAEVGETAGELRERVLTA
jgi:dTDP-4-amino-4,6-dideoxygalactose transaminase